MQGNKAQRLWLFDMDDTLYDASAGMFRQIHIRMERYIADALGVDVATGGTIQHDYWARYGATFLGLERHHGIDPHDFWHATHNFDLAPYVHTKLPRSEYRRIITRLPGIKAVITNGPREYADEVLRILGLQGVFTHVFTASEGFELGRWRCKPDKTLLALAAAKCGVLPRNTTLVEDSIDNLKAAKALGMRTVLCTGYRKRIPRSCAVSPAVDMMIESIADLARVTEVYRHVENAENRFKRRLGPA